MIEFRFGMFIHIARTIAAIMVIWTVGLLILSPFIGVLFSAIPVLLAWVSFRMRVSIIGEEVHVQNGFRIHVFDLASEMLTVEFGKSLRFVERDTGQFIVALGVHSDGMSWFGLPSKRYKKKMDVVCTEVTSRATGAAVNC